MRPREVGGLEPDDTEQKELVELWHLSRLVTLDRNTRITWVVDEYCNAYPSAPRKFIYVWCERYLGRLTDPDAITMPAWLACKKRAKPQKTGSSKKRAN